MEVLASCKAEEVDLLPLQAKPDETDGQDRALDQADFRRGRLNYPPEADKTFGFTVENTSMANLLPDEAGGWGFNIEGKSAGNTSVELQVLHEGHVDIRTPFIPIVIRN